MNVKKGIPVKKSEGIQVVLVKSHFANESKITIDCTIRWLVHFVPRCWGRLLTAPGKKPAQFCSRRGIGCWRSTWTSRVWRCTLGSWVCPRRCGWCPASRPMARRSTSCRRARRWAVSTSSLAPASCQSSWCSRVAKFASPSARGEECCLHWRESVGTFCSDRQLARVSR